MDTLPSPATRRGGRTPGSARSYARTVAQTPLPFVAVAVAAALVGLAVGLLAASVESPVLVAGVLAAVAGFGALWALPLVAVRAGTALLRR